MRYQIPIHDVEKSVTRRAFRRRKRDERAHRRDRDAAKGLATGDDRMSVTAILIAAPSVLILAGVLWAMGVYGLLALPAFAFAFWIAKRTRSANRAPVLDAWRARRKRRRARRQADPAHTQAAPPDRTTGPT